MLPEKIQAKLAYGDTSDSAIKSASIKVSGFRQFEPATCNNWYQYRSDIEKRIADKGNGGAVQQMVSVCDDTDTYHLARFVISNTTDDHVSTVESGWIQDEHGELTGT